MFVRTMPQISSTFGEMPQEFPRKFRNSTKFREFSRFREFGLKIPTPPIPRHPPGPLRSELQTRFSR